MRVFIFVLILFFTGCKKKLSPELEKALSEEGVKWLEQGSGGDIICAMCGSKDCLLLLDQGERKIEVEVGDTFSYDHSTWKVLYIP
ncbi:MAG: hypothetical protein NW226_12035, partial [Microscillaceae bacterium]|nr:hypothetical protein [Microscillaceae bacterium]